MRMGDDWKSEATTPVMEGGLQYHIRCRPGDVARYVLLPGEPDRVNAIAATWSEAREIADHREHRTFSGRIGEVEVTACSTGVGGGSDANAFEELAVLGGDTYIRVGSTGAIQEHIPCGDLIITSAAMRHDGTTDQYVDPAYPAAASYEVTAALVEAAEDLGAAYHVGVTCTTASWYCGQGRPGFRGYTQSFFENKVADLQRAGVLNFEMDAGTILTLASLYGLRAGSVCAVVANRIRNEFVYTGIDNCIRVANRAVEILAGWDARKAAAGKRHWFPSLPAT